MPVRHVLQPGECLQSLATAHGFKDGKAIYDGADNAGLRKKRASPVDVGAGDEVVIPDRQPKALNLATGAKHRVVVTRPQVVLRVQVHDDAGKALGGKAYDLVIGDKVIAGTTTGAGVVEQPIAVATTEAKLVVYETSARDQGRWTWRLRLADLSPPETRKGAWQRLSNLGYWGPSEPPAEDEGGGANEGGGAAGASDKAPDPRDPLVLAIRAFQHDESLDESGKLDAATRDRLVQRHGV